MYDENSPFRIATVPKREGSLGDTARLTLQAVIVDCQLLPGSVVSEADLSQRFGFGLAAVRAAVMRLAQAGWMTPDRRRGSIILPVSAAHLQDLRASRLCLERALVEHAPPANLAHELRSRANIHEAAVRQIHCSNTRVRLHQERALTKLIAQTVAAPRMQGWLLDTWDLCLRADCYFNQVFAIPRDALPLANLATALADGDASAAKDVLQQMRDAFDLRITRALSRSDMPLTPGLGAPSTICLGSVPTLGAHSVEPAVIQPAKGNLA